MKPIEVAAIHTVPAEQRRVSRIHEARDAAEDRGDIACTWSENVADTADERVMRQHAEEGIDPIVAEVFGVERAARKAVADDPEVAFPIGSSSGPSEPDLSVFDDRIHEPSHLTGTVVGRVTESNPIAMVGGYAIPEVNRLVHAFVNGARSVEPNVKFMVTFINSGYDPPEAEEAAFAMIDRGADIVHAERFGVSDAAEVRGVKAIGTVLDTSARYPGVILVSALRHVEPTIDEAIAERSPT